MPSRDQEVEGSSPVIKIEESWTGYCQRQCLSLLDYFQGQAVKDTLKTFAWVLAGLVVALLLAGSHWLYWFSTTGDLEVVEGNRKVDQQGFAITQSFKGFAPGDTITIRGLVDELNVVENFSYQQPGNEYGGIRMVNVADPDNPYLLGGFNTPGYAQDVALEGFQVFVADGTKGLKVYKVEHRARPQLVASLGGLGNVSSIELVRQGNHSFALLAAGNEGLQVIDYTDLPVLAKVKTLSSLEGARDLQLVGELAYVSRGAHGLSIVNVSNPRQPFVIATYDSPGFAFTSQVADDRLYLADGPGGLRVVDLSDPFKPQERSNYTSNASVLDVEYTNQALFLAQGAEGLLLLDPGNLTEVSYRDDIRSLETTDWWDLDELFPVYNITRSRETLYLSSADRRPYTLDITKLASMELRPGPLDTHPWPSVDGAVLDQFILDDIDYLVTRDRSDHYHFIDEFGFPYDHQTAGNTLVTVEGLTFLVKGNQTTSIYPKDVIVAKLTYRESYVEYVNGFVPEPYNLSFHNLTLDYGYFMAEEQDVQLSANTDRYFYWMEGLALLAGVVLFLMNLPGLKEELRGVALIARFELKQMLFSGRTLILIVMLAFFVVGSAWGVASLVGRSTDADQFYVQDANDALVQMNYFTFLILSLFAIIAGFDIIARERLSHTLDLLLCRPLSRSAILMGKLAARQLALGLPSFIACLLAILIIRYQAGMAPGLGVSLGYLIFTQVMVFTFLLLQSTLSIISKGTAASAFMGIGLWLLFVILWPLFLMAIAYANGVDVSYQIDGNPDYTKDATFQQIAGRMALLNPGQVYNFTVALLLPREANDNIEGIPRWSPPVAMLLWVFGLLRLATWRFSREART